MVWRKKSYYKPFKSKTYRQDYDEEFKKLRRKVVKRDGYKCQMPNCGKNENSLQVHHIVRYADNYMLRNNERNLITLCKDCHKKIKDKEGYYAQLFIGIVTQKYRDKE